MSEKEANLSPFQFTNPRVEHFVFDLNEQYQSDSEQANVPIVLNVQKGPIEGYQTSVRLNMKVGDDDAPFKIDASIVAVFNWGPELDDQTVKTLLNKNAVSLLIGYLRPIISQMTVQAGLKPLNLPFIDLNEA